MHTVNATATSHARPAVRTGGRCYAEVHTSLDSPAIESQWRELEASIVRPAGFQSYAWCKAWADACARSGQPVEARIVTVRSGDQVRFLWPLALSKMGGCRVLHALGEPATQYCDALIDCPDQFSDIITAAWQLLKSYKEADLLDIRRMPEHSGLVLHLPSLSGRYIMGRPASAPYLSIDIARQGADRSGRTLNALKRHKRRLAERGAFGFESMVDLPARIQVLEEAMTFKQQWLEHRALWSRGYSHAAARNFSEELAKLRNFLVLRVTAGGRTAAVEAGLLDKGHYLSLMQSYDPEFASYSPGRLLYWHFIEQAKHFGVRSIDFLAPSSPHKREWSNGEVGMQDYLIPLSLRGAVVGRTVLSCRAPAKRLYDALPRSIRLFALSLAESVWGVRGQAAASDKSAASAFD
jgi:CelD/BcsL family acetyltransferase involved in cellulose biosynthesis